MQLQKNFDTILHCISILQTIYCIGGVRISVFRERERNIYYVKKHTIFPASKRKSKSLNLQKHFHLMSHDHYLDNRQFLQITFLISSDQLWEESVAGPNTLMHSINNMEKIIECIMGINNFLSRIPYNCQINTYTGSNKCNWNKLALTAINMYVFIFLCFGELITQEFHL